MKTTRARLTAFVLATASALTSWAAPGDLDPTFGLGGRSFATVAGTDSIRGEAMAVTPDQKIVVAGRCLVLSTLTTHVCVVRLLPNGFFDTSFFLTGQKRIFAAPGSTEIPRAVAVYPDGRVLIAGQCGPETAPTHMCVFRLLEDGSADDAFGTSGRVQFDFPGSGVQGASAVSLLPDGRILLAGQCKGTAVGAVGACVVRLNTDGSLDTSFGSGGRVYFAATPFIVERVTDMVVDSSGRIYVASWGNISLPPGVSDRAFIRRLLANGSTDTGYGSSGTATLFFGDHAVLPRIALYPDGKLAVGLVCRSDIVPDSWCSTRLLPDGSVDTTAANLFAMFSPFPPYAVDRGDYGVIPGIQADGRVVWLGSMNSSLAAGGSGTLDFVAMRTLEGTADLPYFTIGANLKYITMGPTFDRANALAIQRDGKAVLAGTCDTAGGPTMCVARLQGGPFPGRQCSMDIDGDGRVLATVDGLILTRAALGLGGSAVLQGITVSGPRNTWPLIRAFLADQCGMIGLAP
jgi:uncharacterized delta-60 repeat protein